MSEEEQSPKNGESGPEQILAVLEPDQLATAKHHFPRRSLRGLEIVLLWSLRIYLLFMLAVVVYQIWVATK